MSPLTPTPGFAARGHAVLAGTVILVILAGISSPAAPAGTNAAATFVLHAGSGLTGGCTVAGQPDCIIARPTVNVQPNAEYRVVTRRHHLNRIGACHPGW